MTSNVVTLMTKVLGATFGAETWIVWQALLKAAHALPLTDDERVTVETLTHRQSLPASPVRELWLLLGRRSGKSIIAALLAVYATTCRTYTLAPGETGVFMVIASDRKQSRVVKRYISGLLRSHPALEVLIDSETQEMIRLTNGLVIEIHSCSYKSLRGYTVVGAVCDEIAFWDDEDSANPDHEVLIALRAAMASVPEAMLIALTSVYARRGEVYRMHEKHFGKDSSDVLVINAPTSAMNPTISQSVIDSAYEDDPVAAAAEFGAIFRSDVEVFLPSEALAAVMMPGRFEQPYQTAHRPHYAFLDPAGGTGQDSMTMAIAHRERGIVVLDVIREVTPPFSPEATVAEFATVLKAYGITKATSDRYAGSWPVEAFKKRGVTVEPSERTKSEIYQAFLPIATSGQVELLDHAKMQRQLNGLERRTARGGRDSIDHGPGAHAHDDIANSCAGAVVLASLAKAKVLPVWGRESRTPEPTNPDAPPVPWFLKNITDRECIEVLANLGDEYVADFRSGVLPLEKARAIVADRRQQMDSMPGPQRRR